ncbi:MAG: LysM peptidoglycan-binding domain-containing protein [Bacteroidota bacterium]
MNRILSLCFMLAVSLLTSNPISAQCPNASRSGIHVVQAGETAYRIALNYNISIESLLTWNNMSYNDRLSKCQELIVSQPSPASNRQTSVNTNTGANTSATLAPSITTQYYPSTKQSGNRHVVRSGESMASLAQLYGYTEQRFREFNAMRFGEEPTPGSILYSSDCTCDRIAFNANSNVDQVGTIGSNVNSTGANSVSTRPTEPTGTTGPSENPNSSSTSPSASINTNTSMNREELSMIDEINLMRGDPAAYAQYIRDFVAAERARGGFPIDQNVVEELIRALQASPKLSILQPAECIYQAAKAHADDQRPLGDINHQGQDGSWPWDRVKSACSEMANGNENLVAGMSTVRGSVITLLIDEGIPNRGHRKTLMNPEWTHAGCHNAGKIGMFPNYWIQKFGRAR